MLSHLLQVLGKLPVPIFKGPPTLNFFVKFKKSYTFSVSKGIFLKLDCPQCQAVIVTCTPYPYSYVHYFQLLNTSFISRRVNIYEDNYISLDLLKYYIWLKFNILKLDMCQYL